MSQAKKLVAVKEMTRDRYLSVLANEELHLKLYKTPPASKGARHSHHIGDDDDDADDASTYFQKVNIKLPLTFNFERFQKRLRSIHLVSEVKHKIGDVSAKIYAIALNRLEAKSIDLIPGDIELEEFLANVGQTTVGLDPHLFNELKKRLELKDQERGFNFTANDILRDMKSGQGRKFGLVESDLFDSVVDPSSDLSALKRKRRGDADGEDEEGGRHSKKVKLEAIDSILDDDNNSDDDNFGNDSKGGFQNGNNSAKDHKLLTLINQHLKLLSLDPAIPFIEESNPGSFYIPFTELQPVYTKHTFKQYLKNLFGPETLRLVNCMEDKKLVDEKTLSKVVLMKESQIRSLVSKLQTLQIIEVQEIPKTMDRQATRSVFAFRFKYKKALNVFKESLMFNMAEVLDHLEDVKLENKILLDKISREDVKDWRD
ncbi:unnamed protein product [Ambrosiozyma monospora]|uniref:DNA-directed RNA polymerase III subunit RPC3 n=1 Tax=Ambrosiozyma monospora TaxID=43982 RepID=A0A9W7DK21_AMBMO|nr:unnamed protein product [Ambrosiozyma monospora]